VLEWIVGSAESWSLWKGRHFAIFELLLKRNIGCDCFCRVDSTGIPHILEHSVLCGSRKYPLKEPFVELLKGSLQTFLNAFTYPDRTCYPVASTNLQVFSRFYFMFWC